MVEEEETDYEKSIIEEDDSNSENQLNILNEENHQDESVIIKRPMSSKKSKSLETINKANK